MFEAVAQNLDKLQDFFLYRKQINKWIKDTYIPYCQENDITNFNDFLYRGWNGFCGASFGVLTTAPEILLSNIIEFKTMYSKMDPDFRQDLLHNSQMFYLKKIVYNPSLKKHIVNIIKTQLKATPELE